jgi:hypothetical protein
VGSRLALRSFYRLTAAEPEDRVGEVPQLPQRPLDDVVEAEHEIFDLSREASKRALVHIHSDRSEGVATLRALGLVPLMPKNLALLADAHQDVAVGTAKDRQVGADDGLGALGAEQVHLLPMLSTGIGRAERPPKDAG